MEAEKLARMLKEYDRLQSLIDDTEGALTSLAKVQAQHKGDLFVGGSFTLNGYFFTRGDEGHFNVTLSIPLSEPIWEDISDLLEVQLAMAKSQLRTQLAVVKRQWDALEI